MSKNTENITIGKGRTYFQKKGEIGYRPLGNTPTLNISVTTETLKHFDARAGVRTQDREVPVQVTYAASYTADHVQAENVAMFVQGAADVVAVAGAVDEEISFADVKIGYLYQLGAKNVTGVTVEKGVTALVANTDYTLDAKNGTIIFIDSVNVSAGDDIDVTFDITAHSYHRVRSGATVVEGSFLFIADNPEGEDVNYFMEDVKITPNGDFGLITEEWQNMPFNILISTPAGGSAITCDGEPYTP